MARDLLAPEARDLLGEAPKPEKPDDRTPEERRMDRELAAKAGSVRGMGETALSLSSSAIAEPVSGLVGLMGGATQALPGNQEGRAARWQQATSDALTYEPKSSEGQRTIGAVGEFFDENIDKPVDWIAEKGGMGSPALSAAIETALYSAPVALGLRKPASQRNAQSSDKPKQVTLPTVKDIADSPSRKAQRLLAEALERDGLTPDEAVARLQQLGPEARLADLGENLSGLARATTAKPGPARTTAKDFLDTRQKGQQSRLTKAAGVQGTKEFKEAFATAMRDRKSKASPLYDEAYEAPLDLSSPQMTALLERPSMKRALKDAAKIVADEGGGTGHVRLMDAAKRSLDDKIGAAVRSGKREKARRLTMLKNELLTEVDRQVPAFKQAREVYAGEAAMRDAAQLGRNLLTKKLDLDDIEVMIKDMGEGELRAFQMGTMRGLVDKLEGTANNRNVAGKLIESPRAREVLELAFPDEASLKRLLDVADAESLFSQTRNKVQGGSPTARIQQETSSLESTASAVENIARSPLMGTAREVLQRLGIGKVSDKTLQEVGQLLFRSTRPPKGMTYNQRGELVPAPGAWTGRKVTIPKLPGARVPPPQGVAFGGVVAGSGKMSDQPPMSAEQRKEEMRRQMLAKAIGR